MKKLIAFEREDLEELLKRYFDAGYKMAVNVHKAKQIEYQRTFRNKKRLQQNKAA